MKIIEKQFVFMADWQIYMDISAAHPSSHINKFMETILKMITSGEEVGNLAEIWKTTNGEDIGVNFLDNIRKIYLEIADIHNDHIKNKGEFRGDFEALAEDVKLAAETKYESFANKRFVYVNVCDGGFYDDDFVLFEMNYPYNCEITMINLCQETKWNYSNVKPDRCVCKCKCGFYNDSNDSEGSEDSEDESH
ncbi:MAG: hypothetical protein CMK92_04870 [Pseudomonas sp.]|nr:hypothetical protein [Pseudomonas sp.]